MTKKRGNNARSSFQSKSKPKKWHHHITHNTKKAHTKLLHHFHRRKHIEYDDLPNWKRKILLFNHKRFGWLEHFIEKAIPWLVLILLFIIVAELGHGINGLLESWFHTEWHFLDVMAEFAHHYHHEIVLIDQTIIGCFIIDLYFNFFKKATSWKFIKTYFLDIIAVLPLGFIAGALAREVGTAQTATHIVVDTERLETRTLEAEKIAARSIEAEKVAAETFKFERITKYFKSQRFIRLFTRIPRLLRLHRLFPLFALKKVRKKKKVKKKPTKRKLKNKKRKVIKKKKTIKRSNNKKEIRRKINLNQKTKAKKTNKNKSVKKKKVKVKKSKKRT